MKRIAGWSLVALAAAACADSPTTLVVPSSEARIQGGPDGTTTVITVVLSPEFEFCSQDGNVVISGTVTVTNDGSVPTEGLDVWIDVTAKNPPSVTGWTSVGVSGNLAAAELAPDESETYAFAVEFDPAAWTEYKVYAYGNVTNFQGSSNGWPRQSPSDEFVLPEDIAPCATSCTYTQGYWKTHGPTPTGNNENEWPVTGLDLGSVSYTDAELQLIFDTAPGGNGLISLAHQLIAAKLNVVNGADDTDVAAAITAADALIGSLVVPPIGSGSLAPGATSALTGELDDYNTGVTGPGHCEDEEIPES